MLDLIKQSTYFITIPDMTGLIVHSKRSLFLPVARDPTSKSAHLFDASFSYIAGRFISFFFESFFSENGFLSSAMVYPFFLLYAFALSFIKNTVMIKNP